jgi:hypothetical protein
MLTASVSDTQTEMNPMTHVHDDIEMDNAFAEHERRQEEKAFASDPDYVAYCGDLPDVAEFFDVKTHNGRITIVNPVTGGHRTFRIHTQAEDAKFAPGSRMLSLLVGGDNENDYKGFAFVNDDGRIVLWKRYREDGSYKTFADMIARMRVYRDQKGVEYLLEGRCRVCNRALTNPESVKTGIGPICGGR